MEEEWTFVFIGMAVLNLVAALYTTILHSMMEEDWTFVHIGMAVLSLVNAPYTITLHGMMEEEWTFIHIVHPRMYFQNLYGDVTSVSYIISLRFLH